MKLQFHSRHAMFAVLAAAMALVLLTSPVVSANNDDEIVYIDPTGRIRVFDPVQAADSPLVEWQSPSTGWSRLALGDFNADSDLEIAAIGVRSGIPYLAVYDPAATRAEENEDQLINGIPWELLYEVQLAGLPRLIATGEFDVVQPGHEIVYSYELPVQQRTTPDDPYRFIILSGQNGGRNWIETASFDTGNEWIWMATGDVDNSGIDEIALADGIDGTLAVYRLGEEVERIFRRSGSERLWLGAEIGAYDLEQKSELIAIREADYPLASLWVFRHEHENVPEVEAGRFRPQPHSQDEWLDVYSEVFIPSPRYLFLADLTGNGDQEIVMLRSVPQELGNRPRIYVRDNGNETFAFREATLDVDNGYRAGTGADIDGNGRDELVIARADRLRIYTDPVASTVAQDTSLAIDTGKIWSGNLDRNGIRNAPRLTLEPAQITAQLTVGESSAPFRITLSNGGTTEPIGYDTLTSELPPWVTVEGSDGATPGSLFIFMSAVGLEPGTYEYNLPIRARDKGVIQEVESVQLTMEVQSGITVLPVHLTATQYPCPGNEESFSHPIAVEGTSGITFTLSIATNPAWVTIAPTAGTVPSIVTATFRPIKDEPAVQTATVQILASEPGLTVPEAELPITLLCAANRIELPYIGK